MTLTLMPFAILVLAVWRFVHLLLEDVILDRPRDRLLGTDIVMADGQRIIETLGWLREHPGRFTMWLYGLLGCPWCLGIWASGFATLGATGSGWVPTRLSPAGVFGALALWFAIAAGAIWVWLIEQFLDALSQRLIGRDE